LLLNLTSHGLSKNKGKDQTSWLWASGSSLESCRAPRGVSPASRRSPGGRRNPAAKTRSPPRGGKSSCVTSSRYLLRHPRGIRCTSGKRPREHPSALPSI